jgi:hypothetical protein
MKLTFGNGSNNSKLKKLQDKTGKKVYSFSVLSGWTCPFAKDCQSFAIMQDGHLTIRDGKHTKFRCFSASQEVLWNNVYQSRKNNTELITLAAQNIGQAVETVLANFPKNCEILRVHVAGDMKTQAYFDMWMEVARAKKNVLFYAYTKALPFWIKRKDKIPANFNLTASEGGTRDDLILSEGLRYSKVVFSKAEARKAGLVIDTDDSHACLNRHKSQSFALLLHGTQPKGSEASKALQKLKV